jgi:hypothetical protein
VVRCRAVEPKAAPSPQAQPSEARETASGAPPLAEAWLTAASLFLLGLAIRAAAAASIGFPVPEDTAYYAGVARNLVEGRGLVIDSLWSFQTPPLTVPRDAFEVWLPLPSFLAAVPMALAGAGNWFRAAQVSSVLVSAVIPPLAWRTTVEVAVERGLPPGRIRVLAIGSGLVACVIGPLVLYGALPDSTAPFAALALAACLLMARISAAPAGPRDGRLVGLGLCLGLAALTRSEAIWLGLTWLALAWFWTPGTRRQRTMLLVVPAAIAACAYLPWAVRDWQAFGTPLPGQAVTNALYVDHMDVYAYSDPPTLARYLGQGLPALLGSHVAGIAHNLFAVLATQGFPIGVVGLVSLPIVWRSRALRPLLLFAALTFSVTSLAFPVSTQYGTFLHAAGAVFALLIVACMFGLDAFIAAVGRIRHWTRPVAWLGPVFAVTVAMPLSVLSIGGVSASSADTELRYQQLDAALDRAGAPLATAGTVIANFPVWLSESTGAAAIALPDESPASVLDLAHRFGSSLVVVDLPDPGRDWPAVLDDGSAATRCFTEVKLTDNDGGTRLEGTPLAGFHVFRIVCP